jgi:hypothetical protein
MAVIPLCSAENCFYLQKPYKCHYLVDLLIEYINVLYIFV